MSRPLNDNDMTRVLREGLQAQPVPQPAADFDERVLAALHSQRSWWQSLWSSMRPLLSTAACSMVVMLAILHWSLQSPSKASVAPSLPVAAQPPSQPGVTMALLDQALDQPNLRFGTFALLMDRYKPDTEVGPPAQPPRFAPGRSPQPRRRDGLAPYREAFLA